MRVVTARYFDEWRVVARQLLAESTSPSDVSWQERQQDSLFNDERTLDSSPEQKESEVGEKKKQLASNHFRVPKQFMEQAIYVSCHCSPDRWALLYRILYRLNHGEKDLLSIASDPDTKQFHHWYKEIKRDRHKMKAFVRFKKVENAIQASRSRELANAGAAVENPESCLEDTHLTYVAWHQPSHMILPITMPFFVRRFRSMRFVILTPEMSAMWDGSEVIWGEGVARKDAPQDDEMEGLWKTYYRNIFNPARIKLKAMQSEMPKKFWHTMPETEVMKQMLREAPARVERMIEASRRIVDS